MMRMHHIGFVVRDIDKYAAALPDIRIEKTIDDPVQNARLSLYRLGDGPFIELIQPLSPSAFTWAHLERSGEGMHHICYEGLSESEVYQLIRQYRMLKVLGPVDAVLFDRPVIFAVTRARAILEFLI